MSADSPRRSIRGVPAVVPPQIVSDHSIIDSVAGFINDVTLTNQPQIDPKDTITWARFETTADISDPTFGDDWEIDGNVAPPLLLILGYGLGVQVWAIPANGEAVEVLSWRHGHVTALRVLPTPLTNDDEMTDEPNDNYADKRPLMAICDSMPRAQTVAGQPLQQQSGQLQAYCSVNFISLKSGNQVKTIKFKNNVLDILANRTSIAITFPERIAVFDSRTLEDRLSVTTCYPSPGVNPNPVALGARWMAYAENKMLHSKRSGGGCDGDGVSSYTATVLNAAKSLGKGLRELGEQMAAGLTGTATSGGMSQKSTSFDLSNADSKQAGIITILDIKHEIRDISPTTGAPVSPNGSDPTVAHFVAHSDAIVAMEFDNSGMLLLTADKRGHDFHLYRIQPHPAGSHLAAVHHLYVLHRGDTSAKVQNITFSLDSRWVAVSTLRGTTHVFPITPYGGPYGVRTHASLHVVNKLSRFHRSAGLSADNRSSSPISHSDSMSFNQICMPYNNSTIPPYPRPHVILPLAQLRQPSVLGSPPGSAQNIAYQKSSISSSAAAAAAVAGRQRLSSLSDDNGKPLSVCAVFAKARSWLLEPLNATRDGPSHKIQRKAVDSLFIMAGHGALIQYDLDTKLASNVAKEKICDDTPIELDVEAKAQWNLGRKDCSIEIQPPLTSDNWLIKERKNNINLDSHLEDGDDRNDRWLSQVEIITHAGPHRRLWMGPQFVFKTYNTPSGSNLSHIDIEAVEIGVGANSSAGATGNIIRPDRSSPMNMPLMNTGRSSVPVFIESGSYSSIEQSPKLMDRFKHDHLDSDFTLAHGETRLKEDLADAMRESPSVQHKDTGLTPILRPKSMQHQITSTVLRASANELVSNESGNERFENALSYIHNEEDDDDNNYGGVGQNDNCEPAERSVLLIEKVVNPLGTVTTITRSPSENEIELNHPYGVDYNPDDNIIHENCDEALFRPVVTIFCDDLKNSKFQNADEKSTKNVTFEQPPEPIGTKLVVPVIEKQIIKQKVIEMNTNESTETLNERTIEKISMNVKNANRKSKKLNETVSNRGITTIDSRQPYVEPAEKTAKKNFEKINNEITISFKENNLKKSQNRSNRKSEEREMKSVEKIIKSKSGNEIESNSAKKTAVAHEINNDDVQSSVETNDELKFYDKFTREEDSPNYEKSKSLSVKSISPPRISSEIPNLPSDDTKRNCKVGSSFKNVMPLTESNPTLEATNEIKTEPEKFEKKPQNVSLESFQSSTTVTFTLPIKKKSNKKAVDDNKKKLNDSEKEMKSIAAMPLSSLNEVASSENVTIRENHKSDKEYTESTSKSSGINKNFSLPKIDFDTTNMTIDNDATDSTFLPPLSPLEPFEAKFAESFPNDIQGNFSLINFESPEEKERQKNNIDASKNMITTTTKGLPENNIILALCGSLHYENENQKQQNYDGTTNYAKLLPDDTNVDESSTQYASESDEQQYSSLEPITTATQSKSHRSGKQRHQSREKKLSSPPEKTTSSTSSSSEAEESSTALNFKLMKCQQQQQKKSLNVPIISTNAAVDDDDEELRPLISASSMLISCNENFDELQTNEQQQQQKQNVETNSSITLDIVEVLTGITPATLPATLPVSDTSSSASSSSDQANNTSEEQGADSDEPIVIVKLKKSKTSTSNDNGASANSDEGTSISNAVNSVSNSATQQQQQQQPSQQHQQQNAKKKSKRKKR